MIRTLQQESSDAFNVNGAGMSKKEYTIDQALEKLGFGKYQMKMICVLGFFGVRTWNGVWKFCCQVLLEACSRLIDWLVYIVVDCLMSWPFDWLIDWLIDELISWALWRVLWLIDGLRQETGGLLFRIFACFSGCGCTGNNAVVGAIARPTLWVGIIGVGCRSSIHCRCSDERRWRSALVSSTFCFFSGCFRGNVGFRSDLGEDVGQIWPLADSVDRDVSHGLVRYSDFLQSYVRMVTVSTHARRRGCCGNWSEVSFRRVFFAEDELMAVLRCSFILFAEMLPPKHR